MIIRLWIGSAINYCIFSLSKALSHRVHTINLLFNSAPSSESYLRYSSPRNSLSRSGFLSICTARNEYELHYDAKILDTFHTCKLSRETLYSNVFIVNVFSWYLIYFTQLYVIEFSKHFLLQLYTNFSFNPSSNKILFKYHTWCSNYVIKKYFSTSVKMSYILIEFA